MHIAPAETHLPMLSPSTMARGCKPASMLEWTWAMWGRVSIGGVLVVCFLVPGCWSSGPQVDGAFSQEEWTFLQTFKLPEPELCPESFAGDRCDAAVRLGKHLFFDPEISGRITHDLATEPDALGPPGAAGLVSCASCHDSTKFFTDTRSQPGQVSIGTGYTMHNALGLVNTGYKGLVVGDHCKLADCKPSDACCANVYSWNGQYATAGAVLGLALKERAMNSNNGLLSAMVAKNHWTEYVGLFQYGPCAVGQSSECDPPDVVFENLAHVFDAYERHLNRVNSPFDRYIAGDLTALSADAKRGLALFIGKALCVDCHRPPLLSDLKFHNTGVPQRGAHVPSSDGGLQDHVNSLRDPNDPRIQPLEIDDDEARALEAFLRSLTGEDKLPEYLTSSEID